MHLLGQALKEYNTMKIVNDIEDLKALSEKYTSPCAKCDTTEGCPAPVNCKVYNDWKNKLHEEMGRSVLQYDELAKPTGDDQEA